MRRRIALLAAGLAAATATVVVGPPADAATSCRVDYTVTNQWPGGFQASLTLTNTGDALPSWTLAFGFADPGQRVAQGWNATWSQSGDTVTATGPTSGPDAALAGNAAVELGFVGGQTGANPVPTDFSVNGVGCTGPGTEISATSVTPSTTVTIPTTPPTTSPTTGSPATGSTDCPESGHISYTLTRVASPTPEQADAYARITTAMDQALAVYNCHTDITKALSVTYNPSVATADANINGSIRFGQTAYMQRITAMHEISHTLGVGTSSAWAPRLSNGVWTGAAATAALRRITGDPAAEVHGDSQHFWPYGLNYTSEVKSETDLVAHCAVVVALRTDMGL
jgi:hypothetical protein